MIENELMRVKPVPSMWRVLLFRIAQAEHRVRILSDWEENVFGLHYGSAKNDCGTRTRKCPNAILIRSPRRRSWTGSLMMLSSRRSLRAILLLSVSQPLSFLIDPLIVRPR